MLADYRFAVHDLCSRGLTTACHDTIPDDVAELPAVVIGRPAATPSNDPGVYDGVLEIFVLGRRTQPGDYEKELLDLADGVWELLGGTKGTEHGGYHLSIRAIAPRTLNVAGNEIISYVVAVVTTLSTC
jgi:hypothetical protein